MPIAVNSHAQTTLAVIGALAGLAVGPTVTLGRDEVDVDLPLDQLLAHFKAGFADGEDDIIVSDGDTLVRRFSGRAGPFPYRTVEVVNYEADGITFKHLAGPFKRCDERFQLDPIATGTRITHTGTFQLRGGLWTAPLALTAVRKAFETHVRQHLEALAEELKQ